MLFFKKEIDEKQNKIKMAMIKLNVTDYLKLKKKKFQRTILKKRQK